MQSQETEKHERWHSKPVSRERKYTSVRPEPEVPDFLRHPTSTWIYTDDDFSTHHEDTDVGELK